jgi:FAD/FMN-containing dehydrogenase
MNIDLNTAATLATLIVITVTAIAAYVQLRHMRTANQLEALLTVLARIERSDLGSMVDGARAELAEKLPDPAFRRRLEEGNVERTNNPWLTLGNSYEWVGSLVRAGLVEEDAYMDIYSDRVVGAWEIMRDALAIIRRRAGPSVLENFEYLYVRAKAYNARHPNGVYPSHTPRAELRDRWAEADAALSTMAPASATQERAGTGV